MSEGKEISSLFHVNPSSNPSPTILSHSALTPYPTLITITTPLPLPSTFPYPLHNPLPYPITTQTPPQTKYTSHPHSAPHPHSTPYLLTTPPYPCPPHQQASPYSQLTHTHQHFYLLPPYILTFPSHPKTTS